MEYANFIAHCLEIARRGEYYVAPNPMVGAVLVRNSDEQILAEGWHQKYGEGHAEVNCFKHFEEQITNHKLQITNRGEKPRIVVFNKIDNFTYVPKEEDDLTPIQRENLSLADLQKSWMSRLGEDCIFISAKNKENIDALRALLYERVKAIHIKRYPYNDFLFQNYEDN